MIQLPCRVYVESKIESLLDAEIRCLSIPEAGMYFQLKLKEFGDGPKLFPEHNSGFYESELILNDRLSRNGAKISALLAFYIGSCISDRAAVVVMWAFALAEIYNKEEMYKEPGRMVTLHDFDKYFCCGVPTDAEYHRIWTSQKTNVAGFSGNRLDDIRLWPKNR